MARGKHAIQSQDDLRPRPLHTTIRSRTGIPLPRVTEETAGVNFSVDGDAITWQVAEKGCHGFQETFLNDTVEQNVDLPTS